MSLAVNLIYKKLYASFVAILYISNNVALSTKALISSKNVFKSCEFLNRNTNISLALTLMIGWSALNFCVATTVDICE